MAAPPPSGGSQSVTVAVMAAPARIVDGVRLAVGAVPAAVGTAPPAAIPLIMTATTARFTMPMAASLSEKSGALAAMAHRGTRTCRTRT